MAESNGLIYALLFGGGGTITPAQLAALMEGGTPIAVDVNEDGTKVNVHFDLTGASAGQVPMVNAAGTGVEWGDASGGMTNPMTEKGDIIIGGSLGSPTRLALGNEGTVLTSDGSGDMSWQMIEIDETNIVSESTDVGKMLAANGSSGAVWRYPSADNFSSGAATSGQVLKANGSGGAVWGDQTIKSATLSGTTLTLTI